MNILINILKALVILISSLFFVHKVIRESHTLDFAVWNDFKIQESNSKFKNFQDSHVTYSRSLERFFILNKEKKGKIHIKYSKKIDIFEPSSNSKLKFYSLLKIRSFRKVRVLFNNRNNTILLNCIGTQYIIQLSNNSSMFGMQSGTTLINKCFRLTNVSKMRLIIQEKSNSKDLLLSSKKKTEIDYLMENYKIHKVIFVQEKHGSMFLVGIDSQNFFIFQMKKGKSHSKKIGTLPIEGTFPFTSILKCTAKSNCLNIKLFYNRINKIFFLYIPPKHLLIVYKENQTLISKFPGFSMKSLNNMKVHIDRNLLISRVYTSVENELPYIEINFFKYNISKKRYIVIQEKLNYINFVDSYSEISRLAAFDHTGLFKKKSNKNFFSDTVVTSPNGNLKIICLFLQNKRIVCYAILHNFKSSNNGTEHLEKYVENNIIASGVIILLFVLFKIYFSRRNKKNKL